MPLSKQQCHFFFLKLPLEVRQMIYMCITAWSAHDHLSVLCVSKKIHRESKDSFDRRPLECACKSTLVNRLNKFSQLVLKKMEQLSVHFEALEILPCISELDQYSVNHWRFWRESSYHEEPLSRRTGNCLHYSKPATQHPSIDCSWSFQQEGNCTTSRLSQ
jgi:hypothetical protein